MRGVTVSICFVCLGNICRSPMAEIVMRDLVREAGLADRVRVSSAGTSDWHVGDAADSRAAEVLAGNGYDASAHRARQFRATWFADHDLVVAMDRSNERDLRRMAPPGAERRVRLLTSFDPEATSPDVPDPYYGGADGFTDVLATVERGCRGLLDHVRADLLS
jgi:protein-tyrosine phosphatase